MSKELTPQRALVFRVVHIENVRWILANGLHCANSNNLDPNFVPIGNPDVIDRRRHRQIPFPSGGVLSDYVPFYFTPFSPMMLNIWTGRKGIVKRRKDDIAILVSSVSTLRQSSIRTVFADRHALVQTAIFFDDPTELHRIDWKILQERDFSRDPNDPRKMERYQAEALAHRHVPPSALLGMACYSDVSKQRLADDMEATGMHLKIVVKPEWYFE